LFEVDSFSKDTPDLPLLGGEFYSKEMLLANSKHGMGTKTAIVGSNAEVNNVTATHSKL
jgi:hypothetical protein